MAWVKRLRTLPPWRQWVYVAAAVLALVLAVWDIADEGAQYTTVAVLVLVAIASISLRAPTRGRSG